MNLKHSRNFDKQNFCLFYRKYTKRKKLEGEFEKLLAICQIYQTFLPFKFDATYLVVVYLANIYMFKFWLLLII